MILYSIIPAELVFADSPDRPNQTFLEMDYRGEKVQVSPLENNRYIIQRLLSSSPKAYLDPNLQPGRVITMNNV
jgi:hypothetical protein